MPDGAIMTPDLPTAILSAVQDAAVLAFRAGADQGAAEIARLTKVNANLLRVLNDFAKVADITRAMMDDSVQTHNTQGGWLDQEAKALADEIEQARIAISAADPGAKGEG